MLRRLPATGLVLLFGAALPAAAQPSEVTMRLKGGGYQISGQLKSFDGARYVIVARSYGTLSFDARRFDCVGTGCAVVQRRAALATTAPGAAARAAASVAAPLDTFSVQGSNTIGTNLMPALVRAWAASRGASVTPVVGADPREIKFQLRDARGAVLTTVDLGRHGSATAFPALESGAAVLGMSDRPISDEEAQRLPPGVAGMRRVEHEHVIGLDGIMVIVSPESPVVSLSLDQIARIFAGQIKDWSELDLPPGKIKVVSVEKKTGTFSIFNNTVLKPRNLDIGAEAELLLGNDAVADAVANDPNAIGITSFAYQRDAKPVNLEMSCGLVARPSKFAVKTGEYPLARQLYLYNARAVTQPSALSLLRFAMSEAAQKVVVDNQFIDQSVDSLDLGDQAGRITYALNASGQDFDMQQMRKLLSELNEARRLSYTLRFNSGSSELDARSQQDLVRLAEAMTEGELKGKTVFLIGFTDAVGSLASNTTLSQRRANIVRASLARQLGNRFDQRLLQARGYGPLAPVACNDNPEGLRLNRRVEVWVR
jgi:phosphate transport system substrate-binding protein